MLLLSTSSLQGYSLHRIFSFAKKAGYTGLDITITFENFDSWDEKYLKDLSDAFDLPIISFTAPTKDMSSKVFDKILRMAEFIGVQIISFSPPYIRDKDTTWFGEKIKNTAKHSHISLCVKNVEPKFLFFIIPEYRNATLEQIKSVTGETSLDITALDKESNIDLAKSYEILGSSLRNVFFADKHGNKKGMLPGGAGGGISYLPLESFLMRLKTSGYNGYITLKVHPSELGVGDDATILQNLEYMKQYYEKHFVNYK